MNKQDFSRNDAFYIFWPYGYNPIIFAGPLTDEDGTIVNRYFLDVVLNNYHNDDPDMDFIIPNEDGNYVMNYDGDDSVDGITGPHKAFELSSTISGLNLFFDNNTLVGE